jgi:hypothetical protein
VCAGTQKRLSPFEERPVRVLAHVFHVATLLALFHLNLADNAARGSCDAVVDAQECADERAQLFHRCLVWEAEVHFHDKVKVLLHVDRTDFEYAHKPGNIDGPCCAEKRGELLQPVAPRWWGRGNVAPCKSSQSVKVMLTSVFCVWW